MLVGFVEVAAFKRKLGLRNKRQRHARTVFPQGNFWVRALPGGITRSTEADSEPKRK
jgi:hypothetical protein